MSAFETAAAAVKKLKKLSNDELLSLYALYKQATVGDVNTPRPGVFDFMGRAKWDAWETKKGKLTKKQAEEEYVAVVTELQKNDAKAKAKAVAARSVGPSGDPLTSTASFRPLVGERERKLKWHVDRRPPAYFEMVSGSNPEKIAAARRNDGRQKYPQRLRISELDVRQGKFGPQVVGVFFRGCGLDSERLKTAVQYVLDRSPAIGGRLVSDVGDIEEKRDSGSATGSSSAPGSAAGGASTEAGKTTKEKHHGLLVDPLSAFHGVGFFHIPDLPGDSFFERNVAAGDPKEAAEDSDEDAPLLAPASGSLLFDLYRPRDKLGLKRDRLTKLMGKHGPFLYRMQKSLAVCDKPDSPLLCVAHLQLKRNPGQSCILVYGNHCLFDGAGLALTFKALMTAYAFGPDLNPAVQKMVARECLLDAETIG